MKRLLKLLNDWSVAGIVGVVLVAGAVLFAYVRGQHAGYEMGAKTVEQRMTEDRKPAMQRAFDKGYADGTTDGVAKWAGGVKPGVCRATSDIKRSVQNGVAAPARECRLLADGSLLIPAWAFTPTPAPTPEAPTR